ncbi:MAG: choice-of-anchor D domain-containing protein, partial [Candidatus Kapabacteria bacterium]|nr:choice-of-anchor D domain-containing protein [Candidatus Kapabacteria bacterium]MDW7997044.1 choice-of-anchor D domain-containing protein [Bacteroidota bacterium]
GFVPVSSYTPPNSWESFLLGLNGAVLGTANLGRDWRPVLTMEAGAAVTTGAGVAIEPRARLWTVGDVVGYLDFDYARTSVRKELSAPPALDFDTVEIGFSRTRLLTLQNTGDTVLRVTAVELVPVVAAAGEYEVLNPPTLSAELQPNATMTLRIRFAPGQEGERTAAVRVVSTASNSPTQTLLKGVGRRPVSVAELGPAVSVTVLPVPDASLVVEVRTSEACWVELIISDLVGRRLLHQRLWVPAGGARWKLPFLPRCPGIYLWRAQIRNQTQGGAFVLGP